MGISVEREPDAATASLTPREALSASAVPTVRPSATASEAEPTPGPVSEPSPAPEPSPVPEPSPASDPSPVPEPSPSPTPEPAPEPYTLGDAQSNGFSRWQPSTDEPDRCCWTELAGAPPQDRDTEHGERAVVGNLLDPVPAAEDEPEPWQRRIRDVTCQAALVAPSDRGMVARGTVEVVIGYGSATVVAASYPVDVTLEAGGRHELPRPDPGTVDADDGLAVSCDVRFVSS